MYVFSFLFLIDFVYFLLNNKVISCSAFYVVIFKDGLDDRKYSYISILLLGWILYTIKVVIVCEFNFSHLFTPMLLPKSKELKIVKEKKTKNKQLSLQWLYSKTVRSRLCEGNHRRLNLF